MSKTLFILDPGHGDFVNGVNYSKDGKYSPKFEDGTRFYEGANNRDNVRRIMDAMHIAGLDCIDVTSGRKDDVPLSHRVDVANMIFAKRPCVYISIHSDAIGNGEVWMPSEGISVYTSKGQTKSDKFADIVIKELQFRFKQSVKWRTDASDGDMDKEENFYVLRNTSCPAILIEAGFHTNKEEVKRMMTDEFKNKLVSAIVDACKRWEALA